MGTKVVSPTGDPGVSLNINDLTVVANHLGDTDFYDVNQVEVLRGPQGTLYGRNATGGAVNIIYNRPAPTFGASLTGELGDFSSRKLTGFVNLPLNEVLSVRLAGFYLNRDGFGTNSITGDKVDGRNLGSGRILLDYHPTSRFTATLMYEHFGEGDNRNRVGKQLCIKDPGPTHIGVAPVSPGTAQDMLSQGCAAGSLYQASAYGTVNSGANLGGILSNLVGLTSGDVFANHPLQDSNLHDIESVVDPTYQTHEDLITFSAAWTVAADLTLSSITGFNQDSRRSTEDFDRLVPTIPFNTTPSACNALTPPCNRAGLPAAIYAQIYSQLFPGGVVADPQTGTSNKFTSFDYSASQTQEITEELRLASSYSGPLNFAIGAEYINDNGRNDYDVMSSGLTGFSLLDNALGGAALANAGGAPALVAIDPAPTPASGYGHNYYDARYKTQLRSWSGFGEIYDQLAQDLKLTGGLRLTSDRKDNVYYPIQVLCTPDKVAAPNGVVRGLVPNQDCNSEGGFGTNLTQESATFRAVTGRVTLEWTPKTPFTDQTMIYTTYSRGYQGGGFNTPCSSLVGCAGGATFAPEYVDAFEMGAKNMLDGGRVLLNLTGFYYLEDGYQVATIVNKAAANSNIDAHVYGLELESIWAPVRDLTVNANLGYLHTRIDGGSQIDQLNLTQGDPSLTLVKGKDGSDCVVNTSGLIALLNATGGAPGGVMTLVCNGQVTPRLGSNFGLYNYSAKVTTNAVAVDGTLLRIPNYYQAVGAGVPVNLRGNQLPNAPAFTVSVGAQYAWRLERWKITLRGDAYWQDDSYARVFNTASDVLKGYHNVNATLTFAQPARKLDAQVYVKNLFDAQPLTDSYLTDPSSGLFRNVFTLDPRTFGVSLTQRF